MLNDNITWEDFFDHIDNCPNCDSPKNKLCEEGKRLKDLAKMNDNINIEIV